MLWYVHLADRVVLVGTHTFEEKRSSDIEDHAEEDLTLREKLVENLKEAHEQALIMQQDDGVTVSEAKRIIAESASFYAIRSS